MWVIQKVNVNIYSIKDQKQYLKGEGPTAAAASDTRATILLIFLQFLRTDKQTNASAPL